MSDIALINDSQQSAIVTNGIGKNGEIYMKAAGSTDAGALVVYDSGSWRKFADEASSYSNAYSVDFDGSNDYIDFGTSFSPFEFGSGDFTVSQWFKPSSISPSSYQGLVGSHDGGTTIWSTFARSNGFYIFGGGALIGGGTIANGQWYHGIVIRNSGTVTVYLNGSSVASVSNTGHFSSSASYRNKIGADNANASFVGLIDEVAVWSSALSASDVTAIYNSGVPTDISSYSPVGWWRMGDNDGGTGLTITDQGSGGNDGTLTNGPTFSSSVPS
jgi:hypothetical protein